MSAKKTFWLQIESVPETEIDPAEYRDLLKNPSLSRNQPGRWNFANSDQPPLLSPSKLEVTNSDPGWKIKIRRNGQLIFEVPLAGLNWERPRHNQEISSIALFEFTISAFRLAKVIYADVLSPDDQVKADLRLLGLRGWILRGGTPSQVVVLNNPQSYEQSEDLLPEVPFSFNFGEISANPDACGYRLVLWVYTAFGFSENAIPDWFDRVSQRLVIPQKG